MAKEFAKRFYASKDWKQTRDAYFTNANGLCEACGEAGEEVHHIKALTPENIKDPEIAFGFDNLMLLCKACHFEIHDKREMIKPRYKSEDARVIFDEEGNPVRTGRVVIVWGAPASGKSSYVAEHFKRGDIIINLDRIFRCFTTTTAKEEDVTIYLPLMLDIREGIYRMIEGGENRFATAWIITTLPKKKDREELVKQLHAEEKHIDTDEKECIKHALSDTNRSDKEHQCEIISKFFQDLQL